MEVTIGTNCPNCGNKDLCFGYLGNPTANIFIPTNMFTIHGYRIRTYICLKCGHVGLFMPQDKREKLEQKFNDRFGKAEGSET